MLPAGDCFESIMGDGTRMILFLPDDELILDDETLEEASKFHAEAVTQPAAGRKRAAEEDISRPYHDRKMRHLGLGWPGLEEALGLPRLLN